MLSRSASGIVAICCDLARHAMLWRVDFSAQLSRRLPRQDQANFRSLAGLAFEMQPATQTIRHDGVDDMEAEAGAALIAAGGEERIEGFAPDIEAHPAAVVGK